MDYQVVWNGRGPLTSNDGWVQKEDYTYHCGPPIDGLAYIAGRGKRERPIRLDRDHKPIKCACGRKLQHSAGYVRCATCRKARRMLARQTPRQSFPIPQAPSPLEHAQSRGHLPPTP